MKIAVIGYSGSGKSTLAKKLGEVLDYPVRESMAAGCEEKFDYAFAKWILKDGRSQRHKNWYRDLRERYPRKVLFCQGRRDVRRLLERLQ